MPKYLVEWRVRERVAGSDPDAGLRDGDWHELATGVIDKVAESEAALRASALAALKDAFPETRMGGTYQLERVYDVKITPVDG